MHAEQVLESQFMHHLQSNHARRTGFKITLLYITCSQTMVAEQVLESQFQMGITCGQDMHAEQALKSQFNTDITCS